MVRALDSDFKILCEFVENYSLEHVPLNDDSRQCLRAGHKVYLPLLSIWSRCQLLASSDKFTIAGSCVSAQSDIFSLFREAISDVASGYFCCVHGAFKPAHMALRSSIENFLRMMAGSFNSEALVTTSVYELFEMAKSTAPFSAGSKRFLADLKKEYSELCKFTHSASIGHMSGIHALEHFPAFDIDKFVTWNRHAFVVCRSIACALFVASPNIYLKAHYRNKELFDLLIPTRIRVQIMSN
jgi:hypothetical protein